MKTTVDIDDELLRRAKHHAKKTGRPLSALVEAGSRRVLTSSAPKRPYRLPDRRVGDPKAADPLARISWPELRGRIYDGSLSLLPEMRTADPS